jgi:secreted trypsin-like serine protease
LQGDSGGPLFSFNTDDLRYIQTGIVSGGIGECGTEGQPGVFVRVDHPEILAFISNTTGISATINPTEIGEFISKNEYPIA